MYHSRAWRVHISFTTLDKNPLSIRFAFIIQDAMGWRCTHAVKGVRDITIYVIFFVDFWWKKKVSRSDLAHIPSKFAFIKWDTPRTYMSMMRAGNFYVYSVRFKCVLWVDHYLRHGESVSLCCVDVCKVLAPPMYIESAWHIDRLVVTCGAVEMGVRQEATRTTSNNRAPYCVQRIPDVRRQGEDVWTKATSFVKGAIRLSVCSHGTHRISHFYMRSLLIYAHERNHSVVRCVHTHTHTIHVVLCVYELIWWSFALEKFNRNWMNTGVDTVWVIIAYVDSSKYIWITYFFANISDVIECAEFVDAQRKL